MLEAYYTCCNDQVDQDFPCNSTDRNYKNPEFLTSAWHWCEIGLQQGYTRELKFSTGSSNQTSLGYRLSAFSLLTLC